FQAGHGVVHPSISWSWSGTFCENMGSSGRSQSHKMRKKFRAMAAAENGKQKANHHSPQLPDGKN
ncbi:hypothetical protein MJO29_000171, partial [Puccinia striiformis f. sp. tritici]